MYNLCFVVLAVEVAALDYLPYQCWSMRTASKKAAVCCSR